MHLTKETAEKICQLTSQCLQGLSHFRCMSPSLCDYRNGTATFQGIKATQGGPGVCSQTGGHVLPDPWIEDTGLTGKTCATPTQAVTVPPLPSSRGLFVTTGDPLYVGHSSRSRTKYG